jgi:hypothetical protein
MPDVQFIGSKFRLLIQKHGRVIGVEELPDHGGRNAPEGRNGGKDPSQIGVPDKVFVRIQLAVVDDLQKGSDLVRVFIEGGRNEDFYLLGVVKVPVEKGKSPETVVRGAEDLDKEVKTTPGTEARTGCPAVEVEMGFIEDFLCPPEDLYEILRGGPFVFIEKIILGRGVFLRGKLKTFKQTVACPQLAFYIEGRNPDIPVAHAIGSTHGDLLLFLSGPHDRRTRVPDKI